MKGYWIGRVDVSNPDAYQNYVKANAAAFSKYGARFVVRGGKYRVAEGEARARNVVIEFPTYQAALECWDSPEYQAALAADPTSVQAIGLNFRQKIADKDNPNAGLLGDKGKITAKDIPDAPDEATVTEAAVKDFEKWLAAKREAGDPNVAMWLEGGATNAMKFKPALAAALREEATTTAEATPKKNQGDDEKTGS